MKRVSVRTLVLLVELLAYVTAHQFVTGARAAHAGAVWLATDSSIAQWLDDEPNEPQRF